MIHFLVKPRGEYLKVPTEQVNVVDKDNNYYVKPSKHNERAEAMDVNPY